MSDIIIYGALLFAILLGIFIGWYFAYFIADKAIMISQPSGPHPNKPKKPNDGYIKKSKNKVSTPEQNEDDHLKDSISDRRNNVSLTKFMCDSNGENEEDAIDKNQQKSNNAYAYLARKNGEKQ